MCSVTKYLCNRLNICAFLLGLAILIVIFNFYLLKKGAPDTEDWIYPVIKIARGAIVSNGGPCAEIGMTILKKYGNAIDSLIATMVCDGAVTFHKMGLGGGFIATMYIKSQDKVYTINAREVAPQAATQEMFKWNGTLSKIGGLAIGVPGEISGYWEMYKKHGGKAPWGELFRDTIKLCEDGVPISGQMAAVLEEHKKNILRSPGLRKMLANEKGELPKSGDKLKRQRLGRTLWAISQDGPSVLYDGSLSHGIVSEIGKAGGIITLEDLATYKSRWAVGLSVNLSSGHTLHFPGPPSSGYVLAYILKLLDGLVPHETDPTDRISRITEAFKFGYALRSLLGDPKFINNTHTVESYLTEQHINKIRNKLNVEETSNDYHYYGGEYEFEDHGTANIVVHGPNGDVVSATSSINLYFGSGVVSESTGIILNNHMDDFSTTTFINYFGVVPSRNNFISPGKRPMSSMCPVVVLDKYRNPCLAIGAAGGAKIITAVALVTMRKLWENLSLADAVRRPRFHHQLLPMVWEYEEPVQEYLVRRMESRGHRTKRLGVASISAVASTGPYMEASSDHRRGGNTSYLV